MNNKRKGQKFEDKCQKSINSGALSWDKSDLSTETHFIECKTTDKKSFSITKEILDKLWNNSLDNNKLPKLIISLPANENNMYYIVADIEVRRK